LWQIIESESSDQATRRIAFGFWKQAATAIDLERLRSLSSSDPLFDEALKIRLKLRDKTAVELLLERIRSEPRAWYSYAPLLYDEAGVSEAVFDYFEAAQDDPFRQSCAVLQHLPVRAVKSLVREKQDLLLKSPRSWPSLWRSDVPDALALVHKAIAQADPDDLQHFFFGNSFPFPVSQRMLDTLVPILDHFPQHEREWLAKLAAVSGFAKWAREYLPDVISAKGSIYFGPTAGEIVTTLTAAAEAVPEGVRAVLRITGFHRLEQGSSFVDVVGTLRTWLGPSPDGNQLIIAAMVMAASGTSHDIDWWRDLEPESEPAHIAWSNALYILKRRRWQN
jgi:hypothetical protein